MIVIEVVENGRPAQYVFKDYESMKRYVKSKGFKSYKIIRADEGSITASEMLKEKYGLSEEELRELVKNAKSQPEAIARVKARVKRWDWTLERLVSHMWSYERWKREDKTIASQVERELKKSLRIATGITKKTGVPREVFKKNEEAERMRDIEQNVGVKTVPRYSAVFLAPAPRPLPPARVPSPIPKSSEEKRPNVKLILLGILGVGVLYYLIRR